MNVAELARRLHVSRAYVVALADRGDVAAEERKARKARALAEYLAASQAHKEDL